MLNDVVVKTITIADSAAVSSVLIMPETYYLAGIIKDATLDTSVAITFKVSMDNITFYTLYQTDGTQLSYTCQAATAEAINVTPTDFYPWPYVQMVVADNQTGITSIQCVLRQY